MKKEFFLLLIVSCFLKLAGAENKFVYITFLYNEQRPERAREYIKCLELNLAHSSFDTFHIIYDMTRDIVSGKSEILSFIQSKNIKVTYINGRPTFRYLFSLANELYPHRKILIGNADIYFNDTLERLESYDLTNEFLVLTRWNLQSDGSIAPFLYTKGGMRDNSQDAWIFKTPMREFTMADLELGTPGCDSKIAYRAQESGLTVINPCYSIQAIHMHLSGIRNYPNIIPSRDYSMKVPCSWLKIK